jgi:rhamnosyltransferase
MKISLIIPTLNAEVYLPALLGRLQTQTLREVEVLVIDSESDDRTREIASSFGARTMTIPRKEFNHGHTRNIAAQATSGEYLAFLTQDALPVNDKLLACLVAPLERDVTIAVGYGRQVPYDQACTIEKFVRGFNYPETSRTRCKNDIPELGVKTFFCSNACAIYRRDVFFRLGGFQDDAIMNEDMDFVYRAVMSGYGIQYAADAQVFHSHDYSPAGQFRRYVDIGVFFAGNPQLASCARNETEGRRYLREAAAFLIHNGKAHELVHLFLDSAARFLGYRVGINYRSIPVSVMKRMSMNKGYWLLHS